MSQKAPLVLFSGGLDSTYLLFTTLWDKPCDVLTLKVNSFPEDQMAAEKKARDEVYRCFSDVRQEVNTFQRIRNVYELDLTLGGLHISAWNTAFCFSQVPFWMFAALNVADARIHSSVGIGYVMGDQISYHVPRLKKAWKQLWKACKHGDVVPLEFPLLDQNVGKEFIIDYFDSHEAYRPILDAMHYCEFPVGDEYHVCNECPSCKRMQQFDLHTRRLAKAPKTVQPNELIHYCNTDDKKEARDVAT